MSCWSQCFGKLARYRLQTSCSHPQNDLRGSQALPGNFILQSSLVPCQGGSSSHLGNVRREPSDRRQASCSPQCVDGHNATGAIDLSFLEEAKDIDGVAARAAFLQVRERPLPDLHDLDVQVENEYTEIVPHLFLGGDNEPQKVAYLNGTNETVAPNFGFIVQCSEKPSKLVKVMDGPLLSFRPMEDSEGRVRVGIHCFDREAQNDLLKLKECCIQIKAKLKQQCNVLVHCQRGVDCSATVVAAFCMANFDISTVDAREGLKRLRPSCTEQVPQYEEMLRANEARIRRFFDLNQDVENAQLLDNQHSKDTLPSVERGFAQRIWPAWACSLLSCVGVRSKGNAHPSLLDVRSDFATNQSEFSPGALEAAASIQSNGGLACEERLATSKDMPVDFNGKWVCTATWGFDEFLAKHGVGRGKRLIATRAKWPAWEFSQEGLTFTFVSSTFLGNIVEVFVADGSEYEQKDLQRKRFAMLLI